MSGVVLVTGVAGYIGTLLREGLPARGHTVRGLDVVPVQGHLVADATDLAAVTAAAEGTDALVHMAGIATEASWAAISHANIEGTYVALEAARRAGVRRVVLASSNHATGMSPRVSSAQTDAQPRPDTYYGVSKVTMEALGSLYADRYGLDVVCLRIGSALPAPVTPRHLSTWLSPADTVGLVHAALTAPSPGFAVVWGVSGNTRGWWDLTSARALGYAPVDDAETHAAAVIAAHGEPVPGTVEHDRVGGEYAGPDFAVDAVAARAQA
ncbi:NAD-dependent epimerase/dehydratase family protein [Modestobacter sp. I12A-02628]|uniref:NAD(P)-dependent oxidoreductase n=1 Tax=Goekera deserti TaxID=2497753 RepID=A0A7K3WAU8_9ACTN|nr:NAD(P)-dependent oxidoreductase [Goekera deserti]MPR00299.1 NAD-dependent epimerase/dehydratase family protein [Goekera deserti]NDI49473.1 NAD-dependent epimerase/dehydratase family protein [Goekera deserti]NEL52653.1 NAD(P)-dependent oxidoreductase [Goekera deserti]